MSFNDKKEKVFEYLVLHAEESPSVREICKALNLVSTSTVFRIIHALEEEGKVVLKPGQRRNVSVATGNYEIKVPVLGTVAAGIPILAQQSIESFITFNSHRPYHGELFALHVKGDSMINAGILDGDMIVAKKTEVAEEGQIVVALIGDEATVKRFHRDGTRVVLKAENPDFEPIVADEVMILGKVIANFRYYE